MLYIGLISGTSVDGIDAALLDLSGEKPVLLSAGCFPIPENLKNRIHKLCADHSLRPEQLANPDLELAKVDRELGEIFAQAALNVIGKAGVSSGDIAAIGSHGQTVRHQPHSNKETLDGFSLQIGNATRIAELTGIKTISNFRKADMLAGGQGAPLAPAIHQAIAPPDIESCAFLNLGGIANITSLYKGKLVCGFDTGPANTLMDAWIRKHKEVAYDKDGEWASTGKGNEALLTQLLRDPYFNQPHPKSTGREYFHLDWLYSNANTQLDIFPAEDIQATLLELSAQTIANDILHLAHCPEVVYCCGGGAHNKKLRESIAKKLGQNIQLSDTNELGIAPDWIEACLFAWLARKYLARETIDLCNITGASQPNLLGSLTAVKQV